MKKYIFKCEIKVEKILSEIKEITEEQLIKQMKGTIGKTKITQENILKYIRYSTKEIKSEMEKEEDMRLLSANITITRKKKKDL